MPSLWEATGNPLAIADTEYRAALFARRFVSWLGVSGAASPSAWEERAVAQYETLALRATPEPFACHRLGIIYARRGYAAQAREMFMQAASLDDANAEVYGALAVVYSDDPIRPGEGQRIGELLQRQPRWWATITLGDLATRLAADAGEEILAEEADRQLWRFGNSLGALVLAVWALVLFALVSLAVLGVRALFRRGRPGWPPGWLPAPPVRSWLDLLDVVALMVLGNAVGQAARDALGSSLPAGPALGLRALHYAIVVGPALVLVIRRAGRNRVANLGLRGGAIGRHVIHGLIGAGAALAAGLVAQEALGETLRALAPGVAPGALGWGGSGYGGGVLAVLGHVVLVALLAPVVEEVIFRGYVFNALTQRLRPFWAAGLSAVLFAGVHLPLTWGAFGGLLTLGLVSAYSFHVTRSLYPSIVLHAVYNGCVIAAILIMGL